MIAGARAGRPKLLIADEPTTALDVTVQTQILRLLAEKQREYNLAILLITHDFSVVSAFADRVVVMYGGRVMEQGRTADIMRHPRHPYTRALIRCSLMQPDDSGALPVISQAPSSALDIETGCCFAPRCSVAGGAGLTALCTRTEPALVGVADGCKARCHACQTAPPQPSEATS